MTKGNMVARGILGGIVAMAVILSTMLCRADTAPIQVPKGAAYPLNAGPIRLKFIDGELRYLCVGDREIVRRVYFAVRDDTWLTPMPKFTRLTLRRQRDGFRVHLAADCRSDTADYQWQGSIVGTPDGRIVFHADGAANRDFKSQRIGICVLYGAASLARQAFQTVDAAGRASPNLFPPLVKPTLVATQFQTLRYRTGDGLQVSARIAGSRFDMEDQRNFGDSSYKAFAPLAYRYPEIKQGERAQQTFTLEVRNAHPLPVVNRGIHIRLGALLPASRIPHITYADPEMKSDVFLAVNGDRARYANAASLSWGMDPSNHLPDDDNFIDNLTTVVDQAKTARSFAPRAKIHIMPVALDSQHPHKKRDPRNFSPFGAAWTVAAVKYLSLADVDEAAFAMLRDPAGKLLATFDTYAGHYLYAATIRSDDGAHVDALAVDVNGKPGIWLINLTASPQTANLERIPNGVTYYFVRYNAPIRQGLEEATARGENLTVDLHPYEVCILLPIQ